MSSMRAYDRSADGGVAGGGRGGGGGGGRGPNRYRRPLNGNFIAQRGDGGAGGGGPADAAPQLEAQRRNDEADAQQGYPLLEDGGAEGDRLGWLLNFGPASVEDRDSPGRVLSAVDLYFQAQDGGKFKARVPFAPYFYVVVKASRERDVEAWLRRRFDSRLRDVERVEREDLSLRNHLSGIKRQLLKVSCWNVRDLTDVRRELQPLAERQKARQGGMADAYAVLAEQRAAEAREAAALAGGGLGLLSMGDAFAGGGAGGGGGNGGNGAGAGNGGSDPLGEDIADWILDLREYDVLYPIRFAIDTDVRAGHWYTVRASGGRVSLSRRADLVQRADPVVCAWDIEATKLPLQFPDAESDQVFMISYMLDRKGHLIINREVVGGDVDAFEYTPKPEFEGPFEVHSCANEAGLLRRWFDHMREVKPAIYVTYNGDFFDFPFMAVSWRPKGGSAHFPAKRKNLAHRNAHIFPPSPPFHFKRPSPPPASLPHPLPSCRPARPSTAWTCTRSWASAPRAATTAPAATRARPTAAARSSRAPPSTWTACTGSTATRTCPRVHAA
jgi:DNA polymerase epsilon subunit 1